MRPVPCDDPRAWVSSNCSRSRVCTPRSASARVAADPITPAPMTTTSTRSIERRCYRPGSLAARVCSAVEASGRPHGGGNGPVALGYRWEMPRLKASERDRLPDSAFAYIDTRGRRRLPINDAPHVRSAFARFEQVAFEDDATRERARQRLLKAAKKFGIMPVGFITGQLRSERRHGAAGRLVIELGDTWAPGELEQRLRRVLRDPTLAVLHWSEE